MYKTVTLAEPTSEAITIEDARYQLRLDPGEDDEQLNMLIPIARKYAENYCNRFFTEQSILYIVDSAYSFDKIQFFFDVASIQSVNSYDDSVSSSVTGYTFNSSLNTLFFDGVKSGDSLTIELTTKAPSEYHGAKIAMLMTLADLYENRQTHTMGAQVVENPAVINHLYPYRVNIGV